MEKKPTEQELLKAIEVTEDNEEKTKSINVVYKGKILTFKVDEIITPDGKDANREIVEHNGGVCILAEMNGKIAIVSQFRYAFGETLIELPAGKIEKGEDPYDAAIRELEEEVGLKAKSLTPAGVIYPAVGYSSEKIYLYFAKDCVKTKTHFDEDEFIKVHWFTLEELDWMIENEMIKDAKTIVLLNKWQNRSTN